MSGREGERDSGREGGRERGREGEREHEAAMNCLSVLNSITTTLQKCKAVLSMARM